MDDMKTLKEVLMERLENGEINFKEYNKLYKENKEYLDMTKDEIIERKAQEFLAKKIRESMFKYTSVSLEHTKPDLTKYFESENEEDKQFTFIPDYETTIDGKII